MLYHDVVSDNYRFEVQASATTKKSKR